MRVYLLAFSGFLMWGFFPLYFTLMKHLPPLVILMYRGLVATCLMLMILKSIGRLKELHLKDKKSVLTNMGCGVLIATNWLIFLAALEQGYVLEVSMGYFILPLLNMLIGIVFFQEKLRWNLTFAILCASLSLGYQVLKIGSFSWIAIGLAGSLCAYSVLRKTSKGDVRVCFTVEMMTIAPFFLITLVFMFFNGEPVFGTNRYDILLLLIGGGITILPLIIFASISRLIPLAHLGLISYLTPSLQFLEGLFWFKQPLNTDLLVSFVLIWCGLAVYSIGQFLQMSQAR